MKDRVACNHNPIFISFLNYQLYAQSGVSQGGTGIPHISAQQTPTIKVSSVIGLHSAFASLATISFDKSVFPGLLVLGSEILINNTDIQTRIPIILIIFFISINFYYYIHKICISFV
jgi:hypothetical protein